MQIQQDPQKLMFIPRYTDKDYQTAHLSLSRLFSLQWQLLQLWLSCFPPTACNLPWQISWTGTFCIPGNIQVVCTILNTINPSPVNHFYKYDTSHLLISFKNLSFSQNQKFQIIISDMNDKDFRQEITDMFEPC